jgi:hypothetical protein
VPLGTVSDWRGAPARPPEDGSIFRLCGPGGVGRCISRLVSRAMGINSLVLQEFASERNPSTFASVRRRDRDRPVTLLREALLKTRKLSGGTPVPHIENRPLRNEASEGQGSAAGSNAWSPTTHAREL